MFDLDTPISLLLVICLLVLLFAVSVVGCLLGYSSCLVVWIPLFLDPSDGAFGRFDLAALCGCRTLNFCLFCFITVHQHQDTWCIECRACSRPTAGQYSSSTLVVDTTQIPIDLMPHQLGRRRGQHRPQVNNSTAYDTDSSPPRVSHWLLPDHTYPLPANI